jgi:hypothetical protein
MLMYRDEELNPPEEIEPDIGPIVAAFVDGELTIVVGERGTLRIPTPHSVTDLGVPAAPLREMPVNAGAAHAAVIPLGSPEQDVPVVEDERLTHAVIAQLMKHPVHGGGAHSGRSNGGGRAKKMPTRFALRPADLELEVSKAAPSPRFQVRGLSPGVFDFYERRPGYDRDVLRSLAVRIMADLYTWTLKPGGNVRALRPRVVWGLTDIEIGIIRTYPGAARQELEDVARREDAGRVAAVDRGRGIEA